MFYLAETAKPENELPYYHNNKYVYSVVSMQNGSEFLPKICWIWGGYLKHHQADNKRIKEKVKYTCNCEILSVIFGKKMNDLMEVISIGSFYQFECRVSQIFFLWWWGNKCKRTVQKPCSLRQKANGGDP